MSMERKKRNDEAKKKQKKGMAKKLFFVANAEFEILIGCRVHSVCLALIDIPKRSINV